MSLLTSSKRKVLVCCRPAKKKPYGRPSTKCSLFMVWRWLHGRQLQDLGLATSRFGLDQGTVPGIWVLVPDRSRFFLNREPRIYCKIICFKSSFLAFLAQISQGARHLGSGSRQLLRLRKSPIIKWRVLISRLASQYRT